MKRLAAGQETHSPVDAATRDPADSGRPFVTCIAFNCHVVDAPVRRLLRTAATRGAGGLRRLLPPVQRPTILGPAERFDGLVQVTLDEILAPGLSGQVPDYGLGDGRQLRPRLPGVRAPPRPLCILLVRGVRRALGRPMERLVRAFSRSPAALLATSHSRIDRHAAQAGTIDLSAPGHPACAGPGGGGMPQGIPANLPAEQARCWRCSAGPTQPGWAGITRSRCPASPPGQGCQSRTSAAMARSSGRTTGTGSTSQPLDHTPTRRDRSCSGRCRRVLRRRNTLWHPVKPAGIPAWHPLRLGGNPVKATLERVKPVIWRAVNWLWFAIRWRPLTF